MKNYIQRGDVISWTNTGEDPVSAGSVVVVGRLLGVACADIEPGAPGELAIRGVFRLPKQIGEPPITMGDAVTWKETNLAFSASSEWDEEGDLRGSAVAVGAAAALDTLVDVLLTGTPAEVFLGEE